MANKKVTSLTELSAAPATNDLVPIVDVSDTTDSANGTTKKLTVANLFTTPTIGSFTNATHDHSNAAGGGQLTDTALSTAVGIAKGGTGQTTKTEAFDALAPTTTVGDMIYHNGSDNIRLAKGTAGQVLGMNSTATAPEWTNITYAQQTIGIKTDTTGTTDGYCFISNITATVFFMAQKDSGLSTDWNIYRLLKDSSTGQLYITHSTTLSTSNTQFGMAVVGDYLYVSGWINPNNVVRRYDVATLANVTSMTFSGTSAVGNSFSDGTYMYINTGSANSYYKYSISGTTITNSSTVTYTSNDVISTSTSDGTSVWFTDSFAVHGAIKINKYPVGGGTQTSSTTSIRLHNTSFLNCVGSGLFLNGSVLGFSWCYNTSSASAAVGVLAHLTYFSRP